MAKKKHEPDDAPNANEANAARAFLGSLGEVWDTALRHTVAHYAAQNASGGQPHESSLAQRVAPIHPAYFTIAFRTAVPLREWPDVFVIISAYATTGETWSEERNLDADHRLNAELLRCGYSPIRITGYSPDTGHTEPSWAVEMPLDEALDLGRAFLQDAIFVVRQDELLVSRCSHPSELIPVGRYRERIGKE